MLDGVPMQLLLFPDANGQCVVLLCLVGIVLKGSNISHKNCELSGSPAVSASKFHKLLLTRMTVFSWFCSFFCLVSYGVYVSNLIGLRIIVNFIVVFVLHESCR